jgi:eukaryotic-like serine/threonine-protein kinase
MAQLSAGDTVAERYRVEHMLGAGGMATVFAALDFTNNRRVAIKVLNEVLRRHPTIPKRFTQEARAARALTTQHAVKIEGTGELKDGTPYIVMELLEGADLARTARDAGGKLDTERALYLADQIAEALHDAHRHGVLHRDLKPDNVFVIPTPVGEMVKVMDFGISKILEPGGGAAKITMTGTTVGTPQYMPIEQLRAVKDLDGRVDVYALGVLLYEMLAGLRPFDGFSYEEVIMKVATQTAQPLSAYRADLAPGLADTIMRAMAKDRNERIPSMEQLRHQLAPFWSQRRPDFRPYVRFNSTPPPAPTMPDEPVPTIPDSVPQTMPAAAFSQSQSGQIPMHVAASSSGQMIAPGVAASASGQMMRPGAHKPKSYVGLIIGLVLATAGVVVIAAVAIMAWLYFQQADSSTRPPAPRPSPAGSKR